MDEQLKKYKVLLVEDELHIRDLYQMVLVKAGFEVVVAIDGQEGLEMAQGNPDIILLDIMMPKLNGIEVLKRLRSDERTKEICVVLLTNLGQENIIREALEMGAQAYLMKIRISPYELANRVKEFIEDPNLKTDVRTLDLD